MEMTRRDFMKKLGIFVGGTAIIAATPTSNVLAAIPAQSKPSHYSDKYFYPLDEEKGFKPWAPKSTIEKYGEENIPRFSVEQFREMVINRARMGENVHGGKMINDFLFAQIDYTKGLGKICAEKDFTEEQFLEYMAALHKKDRYDSILNA